MSSLIHTYVFIYRYINEIGIKRMYMTRVCLLCLIETKSTFTDDQILKRAFYSQPAVFTRVNVKNMKFFF